MVASVFLLKKIVAPFLLPIPVSVFLLLIGLVFLWSREGQWLGVGCRWSGKDRGQGQRTGVTQVEHPEGARFNRAGWAGTDGKYLTHVEASLRTM